MRNSSVVAAYERVDYMDRRGCSSRVQFWSSMLGSGSPIVTIMQPSQSLMREDVTRGYNATSTAWCSVAQSQMRAVLVIVANIL